MGALGRVNEGLGRAASAIVIVFVAAMSLIVGAQVFWRYVLNNSIIWAEEAARYLLVWITMLGASVALRRGHHVAVTMVRQALPRPLARASNLLAQAVLLLLLGVVVWQGVYLAVANLDQLSPALRIPIGYVYLGIPLGGLLMGLQTIQAVAEGLGASAPPGARP